MRLAAGRLAVDALGEPIQHSRHFRASKIGERYGFRCQSLCPHSENSSSGEGALVTRGKPVQNLCPLATAPTERPDQHRPSMSGPTL